MIPGLGGRLGTRGGAWTPEQMPGRYFSFNPGDASTLTLVSSDIDVAADEYGLSATIVAPSAGKRPSQIATLNGRATARFTIADNEELDAVTGGVATGAGSFWHCAVVRFNTLSASIKILLNHGEWLTGGGAWMGIDSATTYQCSGPGMAGNNPGGLDGEWHALMHHYDGTTSRIYRNGRLIHSGAQTYAVATDDFGFKADGFMPDADVARADWGGSADPTQADRDAYGRFLKSRFGALEKHQVFADGDSITQGFGLGTPATENWFAKACALVTGGVNSYNSGVPSETVADMNVDAATELDTKFSTMTPHTPIACLFGGTNDLFFGTSSATTITRIETWLTARRARGFATSFVLPLRRGGGAPGGFEAARALVVAHFRPGGGGASLVDILIDCCDDARLDDVLDATYYQDEIHPTAAGAIIIGEEYAAPAFEAYWGI
jgi:lysophospholipase L1-like esterase